MTSRNFSKLMDDLIPLIEEITGSVPTDDSKWHHAGLLIRSKLLPKQLKKLEHKVTDRISYHHDLFRSGTSGGASKKEVETHFVQMIKMHHLLCGLQGKDPKRIK